MITRIEIDGFKSFVNFSLELMPFQVFIGPNGGGKSNLFDAIVLLSNIARGTLYDAFRKSRGEIGELFAIRPDGSRAKAIRFAVEMLIGSEVTDSFGTTVEVSSTRLRYELEVERRKQGGFERLYVAREELRSIPADYDTWQKNIPSANRGNWIVRRRRAPYISTSRETDGTAVIYKHQDGRSGQKQGNPVGNMERTVLSSIETSEYPTAYAAKQEMSGWKFLQLDPVKLRAPGSIYSPTTLLPDGSNLAAVLYRMSREDEFAITDISRDMANLVPGLMEISVEPLPERDELLIKAKTQDGTTFSSRVLSDGTLRLLALVALKNDQTHRGVICFEEPENGVHPGRLERIVGILKGMAVDFKEDPTGVPRQVLVNTHSPKLLSHIPAESLVYVEMRTHHGIRVTKMTPIKPELLHDPKERFYTEAQVREFLDSTLLKIGFLDATNQ